MQYGGGNAGAPWTLFGVVSATSVGTWRLKWSARRSRCSGSMDSRSACRPVISASSRCASTRVNSSDVFLRCAISASLSPNSRPLTLAPLDSFVVCMALAPGGTSGPRIAPGNVGLLDVWNTPGGLRTHRESAARPKGLRLADHRPGDGAEERGEDDRDDHEEGQGDAQGA